LWLFFARGASETSSQKVVSWYHMFFGVTPSKSLKTYSKSLRTGVKIDPHLFRMDVLQKLFS